MKETNIISSSVDEIDQMEKMYSAKNKRENINIKNRIGDHEKVIFCYYEIVEIENAWGWGKHPEITPYILTELKFIYVSPSPIAFQYRTIEITLDKIDNVRVRQGMAFSKNYQLWIGNAIHILDGANVDILTKMSDLILKAKANFHNRTLNPVLPDAKLPTQNLIADQLEKLADLHRSGVLTDDEYKRAKERVLAKK